MNKKCCKNCKILVEVKIEGLVSYGCGLFKLCGVLEYDYDTDNVCEFYVYKGDD